MHPEDRAEVHRSATAALQAGHDYRMEHRVVHPNGAVRWIAVAGRPVRDALGRTGSVGVLQDITELKQAEHVLRTQNELLEARVRERTQRLSETVGELEAFSYSISHDMRAPLRAMHNYAHLLQTEHAAELTEMARHYLGRIEANAARLDLLIRDVLAYSKVAKESIETKPVDLDRFTRDLVAQLPETAMRQAIVDIPTPLPRVLAHEAYLSQIFTNLIGNGVKFVSPDTIPRIEITAEPVNGSVRVAVRDNGIGIAPADYERIFQIFGRLHPAATFEGTGIGLAIVKKAVQRMGGEIGVESSVGSGSTFWFTLARA
jgi:signal transduction histidine kinase